MDFIERVDRLTLEAMEPLAESDMFAVYGLGGQTYLLVQRHQGTPWTGLRLSGDGLFRVVSLLVDAMRHLYRDVSSHLSPNYSADAASAIGSADDLRG